MNADEPVFDHLAVVGKAFGNARRLELVGLLAQGERTVDSLARAADMGLTSVSAHLQVLKLSNLVRTRRSGTRIYYRLAGDDVAALYEAFLTVARHHSADVEQALAGFLGVPDSHDEGVVTRAELVALVDDQDVVVLDVRPVEEYLAGHVPGAQNVPLEELSASLDELRPHTVVAYCRGSYCVLAHDALQILRAAGVAARRLEDGMLEWRTHGLPVAVGA